MYHHRLEKDVNLITIDNFVFSGGFNFANIKCQLKEFVACTY